MKKPKVHYSFAASFTTDADIAGMIARGWKNDVACNNDGAGFDGTDIPGEVTCRNCMRVMLRDARGQVESLTERLAR